MSSKKWLKKYGLAAKKLTIIDLVGPTFISHEPKYVSAIDRHVLARVFDDVCIYNCCLISYIPFISLILV